MTTKYQTDREVEGMTVSNLMLPGSKPHTERWFVVATLHPGLNYLLSDDDKLDKILSVCEN